MPRKTTRYNSDIKLTTPPRENVVADIQQRLERNFQTMEPFKAGDMGIDNSYYGVFATEDGPEQYHVGLLFDKCLAKLTVTHSAKENAAVALQRVSQIETTVEDILTKD